MIELLEIIQDALPEGFKFLLSIGHFGVILSVRYKDVKIDRAFDLHDIVVLEEFDILHEVIIKMINELKEAVDETGI
jgi:hypothetical protein